MISKMSIERKLRRKRSPVLVKTLIVLKKKSGWDRIANLASLPRRKRIEKNLDEIDKIAKEGDTVVIPGKVLGGGMIKKKIRVCALSFSLEAVRKLKEMKCEIVSLESELKTNPQYRGVLVLR